MTNRMLIAGTLTAGEHRFPRPVVEEALDAGGGVFRVEGLAEQCPFQGEPVGRRAVETHVDRALRQSHGHDGAGGERVGPFQGGVEVALDRDDPVDEAHGEGLRRPHLAARPEHLLGPGPADQAGQPLGTACTGEHAEEDLRHAQTGVLRREAQVAGQRRFEAAAQGEAVDGGDHRPGNGLEGIEGAVEVADQPVGIRLDLADLGAGGEDPVVPGQHHRLEFGIGGQAFDVIAELVEQLGRQGVHRRAVEPDELDAVVAPLCCDEFGHGRRRYERVSDSSDSAAE
jgi:hypothetical protein